MSQQTYIKIGGYWKSVTNIWIKISGVWKQKVISYVKSGGSWKQTEYYAPVGVVYTWNPDNGDRSGHTITGISHGMTTGSTFFDLHISHNYSNSSMIYVAWNIIRTSPNPLMLASGADNNATTGYGVRSANQNDAERNDSQGALSQAIVDGDQIEITIDQLIEE